jgi:hypothetical protein
MWSPISRVGSIELDGILKACTTKVVAKRAIMAVITIDSKYSLVVDLRCSTWNYLSFIDLRLLSRSKKISTDCPPGQESWKCNAG